MSQKRFKGKYFDSGDVLLGIWINVKNWNGITPLIIAIRHGFVDIAKMFIKRGAKVNAQDNRGRFSALHCAVFYKYPSIIRMLLEGGAEFNALEKLHYTPLHIAVLIGNLYIVMLLLTENINLDIQDLSENIPLYLAIIEGSIEITRLLLQKGAKVPKLPVLHFIVL